MELEFFRGKRVCVPGATGLVGSYVVKELVESGAVVRALRHDRQANEYTNMAKQVAYCNLAIPGQALSAVSEIDVVVSCAGLTGGVGMGGVGPVGPATAIAANILHACAAAKVPLLGFLSSTTVYAPSEHPVFEEESFIVPPYPLYAGIGESKRYLEKLHRFYAKKTGIQVAIVRPSGAYGRYDNFDQSSSHVVPGLLNRALALKPGEPFEVWGDGGDIRDLVHAADVARGFLLAIAKAPTCDPINLASGVGTTTGELARMVLDVVGSKAEIVFNPDKPTALRKRLVSVEKARSLLGFEAQWGLKEGLADTVQWLREQR
jgi:GDP-L-fucose synthase